ncbi:MAG: AbrB/MazE/SpoVT family DNA-binding domain-containing protein [Candidatus Pacebacteria bacterium]|nr:AbrB/MazE/SpoVT family DNA-binding domain-containing protein [Candidatus Paceibacterota bacterium]
MSISKLSQKYQITVPSIIRKELGLRKGSRISIQMKGKKEAVIKVTEVSLVKKYKGIGKNIWEKLGGAESYLNKERNSWKQDY